MLFTEKHEIGRTQKKKVCRGAKNYSTTKTILGGYLICWRYQLAWEKRKRNKKKKYTTLKNKPNEMNESIENGAGLSGDLPNRLLDKTPDGKPRGLRRRLRLLCFGPQITSSKTYKRAVSRATLNSIKDRYRCPNGGAATARRWEARWEGLRCDDIPRLILGPLCHKSLAARVTPRQNQLQRRRLYEGQVLGTEDWHTLKLGWRGARHALSKNSLTAPVRSAGLRTWFSTTPNSG